MSDTDEVYQMTPEEEARISRALEIWRIWKPGITDGHALTPAQECAIVNMLFRMQEAEHAHFSIEIPKMKVVESPNVQR